VVVITDKYMSFVLEVSPTSQMQWLQLPEAELQIGSTPTELRRIEPNHY
jgi:hypothetical protein